jgi:hypothetical protein
MNLEKNWHLCSSYPKNFAVSVPNPIKMEEGAPAAKTPPKPVEKGTSTAKTPPKPVEKGTSTTKTPPKK